MDLAVLKTLEYNKIIKQLAECTSSTLGRELVENLLPSNEYEKVEAWIAETAEGRSVLQVVATLPLGGIRDIREFLKKSKMGAVLETHELLDIASTLYAMRKLKRFFKEIEIEVPRLQELARNIEIVGNLENNIEAVVDEHGVIRDNASVELQRIRREIKQSQSRIKERLDSVLRATEYQKYFQDVLITMRGDRYVVPIKQEYRQFFPGI
ncbi:MAG: mutS2 1, partial [Massilibacillus sp.]|nr:mutS2 1 [Massilibacillus sp.]